MIKIWTELSVWNKAKWIGILILVIFLIVFGIINNKPNTVDFIFFRLNITNIWLILVCGGVGYLVSTIFSYRKLNEKEEKIQELHQRMLELEKNASSKSSTKEVNSSNNSNTESRFNTKKI